MDKLNKLLKMAVVCLLLVGLLAGCSTIKKQEDVKGTLSGQVYFRDEPLADSATMDTTVIVDQHRLAEPQIIQVDQNGVYTTSDLWAGTVTNLKVEHQSDQYGTLYNEFEIILDQVPAIYHIMMGGWSAPVSLPFNTDEMARMPWYDEETNTLYYVHHGYLIYYTTYNETTGEWSLPQEVPGEVNDYSNCISPVKRGNHLYFGGGGWPYDIYRASWDGSQWTDVEKVPGLSVEGGVNWHLWIDRTETLAYYISRDSANNYEVYKAHKEGESWVKDGKVDGLCSDGAERAVFFEENEGKFYLLSDRDGNLDIFVAESEDAEWKRLNNSINSLDPEGIFWTNGEVMFLTVDDNGKDIAYSKYLK